MLKAKTYRLLLRAEQVLANLTGWHAEDHQTALESYFHQAVLPPVKANEHSLVVYAGTIGEFNAISSFISAYFEHWPSDKLIVLMGSRQYFSAVASSRPETIVGALNWRSPHFDDAFLKLTRPRFLVIAEGPCMYGYFRPRFELGLLVTCLVHKLPVYVVNSCIYGLKLPSRTQKLEQLYFGDLHEKAIRHWYVPSAAMSARLAEIGVSPQRISDTGNLKFDGLHTRVNSVEEIERREMAIAFAGFRPGPIFVGGNVNFIDEQIVVINAWQELRAKHPHARLVIAPRYLQNRKVIPELLDFLQENEIEYGMWSEGLYANKDVDLLVLDTYGDLFYFYGIATVCYAGRHHGVLESLGQGKPTLASTQWNEEWSGGMEIYKQMIDAGALIQVPDLGNLGKLTIRLIEDDSFRQGYIERAHNVIKAEKGAGLRAFKHILEDYGENL